MVSIRRDLQIIMLSPKIEKKKEKRKGIIMNKMKRKRNKIKKTKTTLIHVVNNFLTKKTTTRNLLFSNLVLWQLSLSPIMLSVMSLMFNMLTMSKIYSSILEQLLFVLPIWSNYFLLNQLPLLPSKDDREIKTILIILFIKN